MLLCFIATKYLVLLNTSFTLFDLRLYLFCQVEFDLTESIPGYYLDRFVTDSPVVHL